MDGVIVIDNEYGIKAMDYALGTFCMDRGKRRFKAVAYYGSVAKCLQEYVKRTVHSELTVKTDISLSEAAKRIGHAVDRSTQAIRAAFPEYKVIADE